MEKLIVLGTQADEPNYWIVGIIIAIIVGTLFMLCLRIFLDSLLDPTDFRKEIEEEE